MEKIITTMEEGLKAFPPRVRKFVEDDDLYELADALFELTRSDDDWSGNDGSGKDRSKRQNRRKTDFQKRKALLEKLTHGHSEQIYSCGNHVHSRKWIGCEMQKHETAKRVRARYNRAEELPSNISKFYRLVITTGRKRLEVELDPSELNFIDDELEEDLEFQEELAAETLDAERHAISEELVAVEGNLYKTDEKFVYMLKVPAENGKTRIVMLQEVCSMTV